MTAENVVIMPFKSVTLKYRDPKRLESLRVLIYIEVQWTPNMNQDLRGS